MRKRTRGASCPALVWGPMAELLVMKAPEQAGPVPLADRAERERALDTARSWIVEAPAGSGKTGLLIQRFLKLLASDTVEQPSQVLAITFTRKATSEMRVRVVRQLAAARADEELHDAFDRATRPLAEAVLRRDAQLGWALLDNPRQLNIRTIDSVCAEISASLPVLSGGVQAPTAEAAPLFAEAARRTVLLLGGEDASLTSALELLLLHRDGNLANCQQLIAEMLEWREQWGALVPLGRHDLDDKFLDREVLPKLEHALDLAICQGLTRLSALPNDVLEELCALAAEMGHAEGYDGSPSPIALCAGKTSPPEEKAAHVDHWRALLHLLLTKDGGYRKAKGINKRNVAFQIEPAQRVQLAALIERVHHDDALREALCSVRSLPPNHYPAEQWVVAKALFRVLRHALIELQMVFAERKQCDFTEVSLLTSAALRRVGGAQDLAATSAFDLVHLLVDEMQDTSSSQYELIHLLTQSFDGGSQTVLLVGDPKQSIYRFRQARVERFLRTMKSQRLGDVSLGTLRLTANFRSERDLIGAFNDDFCLLFPHSSSAGQIATVPYSPAAAVRSASPTLHRAWHIHALPYTAVAAEKSLNARDQRVEDAEEIRRIVELWRARPLPTGRSKPWKIAVLVRHRSHLLEVVRVFKQLDGQHAARAPIPFRAVDIEPLGERQEILDLFALTRALLHPADRTAWLALLRTPWCGLTLRDLHLLAGQDDPAYAQWTILELIERRGDLLSEDGVTRLQHLWSVLTSHARLYASHSLSERVEFAWRAFGAPACATEEELANVERFFALLDVLEQPGGQLDLVRLKLRLGKLYAAPQAHPEAVDLMTIHGAKGLEWDVVLVPALERTPPSSRGRLLTWMELDHESEDQSASSIVAPIKSKGGAGQELNEWMKGVEDAREKAELKRLFYVVCTRAREELHLFAAPARNKDGGFNISSNSLLGAAEPAFDAQLARAPGGVVEMPSRSRELALAAAATATVGRPLARIPLPAAEARTQVVSKLSPELDCAHLAGSFAARAVGNAMHAFLESLAEHIRRGAEMDALAAEASTWSPRITAVLRAQGLAPAMIERSVAAVLRGLERTLASPEGRWILAAHPSATSESAHTSWHEERTSIRIDRSFLAGPEPMSDGDKFLWIVDYKTAVHGASGLAGFFAEQKMQYAPQLQRYARALAADGCPLRLALFYPMLGELIWWKANEQAD